MNTSWLATFSAVAPTYALFKRWSDDAAWRRASLRMRDSVAISLRPRSAPAKAPASVVRPASTPAVRRPLRVVRMLEPGQAPAHSGRILMSGRMADICAELDRMAAREAAAVRTN